MKLKHTDTTNLKEVCDQCGKSKSIKLEALPLCNHPSYSEMVPTLQPKFP
jgi:hypothetical protein